MLAGGGVCHVCKGDGESKMEAACLLDNIAVLLCVADSIDDDSAIDDGAIHTRFRPGHFRWPAADATSSALLRDLFLLWRLAI